MNLYNTGASLTNSPDTATQTALNTKANLSGPTFTGTVSIPTLNVNGNLTTTGSYGAYLRCTLNSNSYGAGTTEILWNNAPTFSYGLSMTNNKAIQFTSAGVYAFFVQLHSNTPIATAQDFQLQAFYSTNGTNYSNYENSEVNILFNGVEEFTLNGLIQVAANSYLKISLVNNSGADIVFNTGGQWTRLHCYRVG